MATTLPRTILPRNADEPKVPGGFADFGITGAAQIRAATARGRVWTETWADLRRGGADVENLLAFIAWAHSTKELLDVVHSGLRGSGAAPLGAGGGTPLIKGASQTGETIETDGWTAGVTNVVRAGDVLKLAGLETLFQVVADANSDGSGNASIRVNPKVIVGSSPTDNGAVTRTGCTVRAIIVDYNAPRGRAGQFVSGLSVTFREVP